MNRTGAARFLAVFVVATLANPPAPGYVVDTTIAQAGGCPQPDHWNLSLTAPLNNEWSTSLPLAPATVLTVAPQGTPAQLTEIEQVISSSLGAWAGVTGTVFNAAAHPGLIAPLVRVNSANACTNDQLSNADGLNTICFNQASVGFASGVLAFTRIITANAPGVSVGASGPAAFVGQILDSDTLFRNDGQALYATPAALSTSQGQGAYDLESLLIHELGHWLGLDHSAVWRAVMFPFAPPAGQFLGDRPTSQAPEGPLADDDRTGARVLYADLNDTSHAGSIHGRILPANLFALATVPSPSTGASVTGIFGAHVVALDADTGAVIAGTLGGWSCDASAPPTQFDGSFELDRLAVGRNYKIYAEPLLGVATPGDFAIAVGDLCRPDVSPACTSPAVNTNFNVRVRPAGP